MEQAEVARIVARYDRDLLANAERHRAVLREVSDAAQRTPTGIGGRPALVASLSFAAGAGVFAALLVVLKASGL